MLSGKVFLDDRSRDTRKRRLVPQRTNLLAGRMHSARECLSCVQQCVSSFYGRSLVLSASVSVVLEGDALLLDVVDEFYTSVLHGCSRGDVFVTLGCTGLPIISSP